MTGMAIRIWPKLEGLAAIGAMLALALLAASPARAQSAADLLDRVQRLEAQNRALNGQVEQLQNQNRQLSEQLRRLQGDIEFRLNELEGQRGQRPTGQRPPAQQPPGRQGRNDAFDPSTQPPGVGGTRDLAGMSPGGNAAQQRPPGQPPQGQSPRAQAGPGAGPLDLGTLAGQAAIDPALQPRAGAGGTPQIVQPSPRDEYDLATGYMQRREFDQAEIALRNFVQNHPRDRLVPDATYQLGESFYQRRQFREAAEQFLKISTDFPRAARAPSSLLRLGQSLNSLGEREAGCAAWAEANRRYPNAGPQTRQAIQNEQQRARC